MVGLTRVYGIMRASNNNNVGNEYSELEILHLNAKTMRWRRLLGFWKRGAVHLYYQASKRSNHQCSEQFDISDVCPTNVVFEVQDDY